MIVIVLVSPDRVLNQSSPDSRCKQTAEKLLRCQPQRKAGLFTVDGFEIAVSFYLYDQII